MRGMQLGIVALATLTAAALLPSASLAVVPANGGMVGGTLVTVDASPEEQRDPHVDGDFAVLTQNGAANPTIRYYDFATSLLHTIPDEPGAQDTLSNVSGGVVSFSRQHPDGTRDAMAFDIASATLTTLSLPGAQVFATAIGGDTVAFVDAAVGNGDILVSRLSAPGALPVNLTAPVDLDTNPAVSPLGDAVVWERCSGNFSNCGISKSMLSGGTWGAAKILVDTGTERSPDTDGSIVVYVSGRSGSTGGPDVYFQPLSGGVETQLEIAGRQVWSRVSGGVIALETVAAAGLLADVFVYVIATNTLFQVTATPLLQETLSDVTLLPNGDVRVVWAADDGTFNENNIYARTFSVSLTNGDTTPPSVAIATPADGALFTQNQLVLADYACADEPGGSGLASCVGPVAAGAPIDTASVGGFLFDVTGTDNAGNAETLTHGYGVVFCANPFAPPVDDLPVLNRVNAGRAVPVKFSLCGDQGLAVLAPGYPKAERVACDSTAPVDGIEETASASDLPLSYDPSTDLYRYVWKTSRLWAGICAQLVLKLSDGTYRRANFQFR
jgi:hypothetical protein